MLMLCLLLVFGQGDFTPPKPDLSFEKGMNEGSFERAKVFEIKGKFESEEDKELLEMAQTYYESLMTEDYTKAYELMCQDFKNALTFKKFSNQKRLDIEKVIFYEVVSVGDSCKRVRIRIQGESSGAGLGKLEVNDNMQLSKENGSFRIFKNPYSNAMGLIPKSAKYQDPCVEPKQSSSN